MPEALGSPPSPRTALFWNGTAWQWALVDAAGHLQLDVVTSGLPAGAATAAAQALALAQLQLIEDLRDALQSVGTDRLIVRGEDQLFSIHEVVVETRTAVISGAGGRVDSDPVPGGRIWVITNIADIDNTSPTTSHTRALRHGGVDYYFDQETAAFAAGAAAFYHGLLYMEPTDVVRVWFAGGLVGDTCTIVLTGYEMTVEV